MADKQGGEDEEEDPVETVSELKEFFCEFKHLVLRLHHFKHANQARQLQDLGDPAEFRHSDHANTIKIGRFAMHKHVVKGYNGDDVDEEPADEVTHGNLEHVVNYLEVVVVEGREEYDEDVRAEYAIHNQMYLLRRCHMLAIIEVDEGDGNWRVDAHEDEVDRHDEVPGGLGFVLGVQDVPFPVTPIMHPIYLLISLLVSEIKKGAGNTVRYLIARRGHAIIDRRLLLHYLGRSQVDHLLLFIFGLQVRIIFDRGE